MYDGARKRLIIFAECLASATRAVARLLTVIFIHRILNVVYFTTANIRQRQSIHEPWPPFALGFRHGRIQALAPTTIKAQENELLPRNHPKHAFATPPIDTHQANAPSWRRATIARQVQPRLAKPIPLSATEPGQVRAQDTA